jgi:hypothetical protein
MGKRQSWTFGVSCLLDAEPSRAGSAAEVTVFAKHTNLAGLAFILHPASAFVGGSFDDLFIKSVTEVVAREFDSPKVVVAKHGQDRAIRKHFHMVT